jgi:hypothetical protein
MRKVLCSALVVGLMCFVPEITADVYRSTGTVVWAHLSGMDENDVPTDLWIVAEQTHSRSAPGSKTDDSILIIFLQNEEGFGALDWRPLQPGELQVHPNLNRATLNATITANSPEMEPKTLTIDLDFIATGEPFKSSENQRFHSPGLSFNFRYVGIRRDADIAGSIGGVGYLTPVEVYLAGSKSIFISASRY